MNVTFGLSFLIYATKEIDFLETRSWSWVPLDQGYGDFRMNKNGLTSRLRVHWEELSWRKMLGGTWEMDQRSWEPTRQDNYHEGLEMMDFRENGRNKFGIEVTSKVPKGWMTVYELGQYSWPLCPVPLLSELCGSGRSSWRGGVPQDRANWCSGLLHLLNPRILSWMKRW